LFPEVSTLRRPISIRSMWFNSPRGALRSFGRSDRLRVAAKRSTFPMASSGSPAADRRSGGRLLEASRSFRALPRQSSRKAHLRRTCTSTRYSHTLSHSVMRAVAESSGLRSGFASAKYLFYRPDLAFSVLSQRGRRWTWGNLSALWRTNDNVNFLQALLSTKLWSCNSAVRSAAKKAGRVKTAFFVPETSCIAPERPLCRSVVAGGQKTMKITRTID